MHNVKIETTNVSDSLVRMGKSLDDANVTVMLLTFRPWHLQLGGLWMPLGLL